LGANYKTFYEKISLLGPIIVIFYLIAFGVSYYKRKIRNYYEDIDKRVEEQTAELNREKEYTRNLLKSSFDAIIHVDKDGYISEVNERTCELFEYDKEEMVKKKVKDFYAPGEGSRVMISLRDSESGTIENFNTYVISKKEEKIPILLSAAFLYDRSLNLKNELSGGRRFPTVGYYRDIRAEEAVDNIAKEITYTTDEKTLLDKIVEIVAKTLKAEACSILTYKESIGLFKVITSYGMPDILKKGEWLEEYDEQDSSMIAKTFALKQSLNISDIDVQKKQPRNVKIKWEYAQNLAKYSRFGDFKSFLGTPLIVQGEVYGIIRVINKYCSDDELDNQGFTKNDEKLLERISTQVSILIEKVRDKERFEAISKVGRKLNEMLDVPLDKLLEIITKEVVKGMQFKACRLRLIDGTGNLKIKACHGLKEDYKGNEKYNLKIGEGVSGEVVKTGEYCKIENLQKEEKYAFRETLEKEELSSMLSMPLKYRNRVIGVINCYTRRPHKFTDQEIQMMNTFAIYASTAIQNKKRMDELMALNEIGSELVKPIKIEELFDLILKNAKALSRADRLCIKIYDHRSGKIKTVRALNCKWHKEYPNYEIDIREGFESKILGEVIESGQYKIIDDYDEMRKRLKEVPGNKHLINIKSSALIPIKIDDKVYGVLNLENHRDNLFSEDDLLVLEAFSSQAAIALKNANFFNKLQRVTETFPKISELNINIDKVLDNIAEIAADVLETDVLVLYQYNEKNKEIVWPPICKGDIKYPKYMLSQVGGYDAPLRFIKRGKNHYAENSHEDPIMAPGQKPRKGIPKRFLFREKIVSSAGILLRVGQEINGIMFINYRTPHKFDEDYKRIVENYASYIAVAIQNVRHFREKEIAAGLKTLGELAPAVAHKIKNDIGTINLYTADLLDETKAEDPHYFNLSKIKEKIHKITADIDFLMNASKLKIPEKEFVYLENIIDEIENEILLDLKTRNIKLEKRIATNLPKIKIDPVQIKMVLSNLVYNSIDAMPKGGKILISISKSKDAVLLDWKDTGTGISPEYAVKIFQPFWTIKGRGFGLGLFLSKTIIEEHRGSIYLDLKYKKGAKFIIKFPIKE
jgi:PAS domain S-box-containing protein